MDNVDKDYPVSYEQFKKVLLKLFLEEEWDYPNLKDQKQMFSCPCPASIKRGLSPYILLHLFVYR